MKVSFVIPAYNSAEFLHPAVESCLKQTYKDIEVVIVDDCSTDSTKEYLAWLEKQGRGNVKIVRNERNLGRCASRNIGNAATTGDIIAVLDADDISALRRAELTVDRFKKGAKFVHGAAQKIDPVMANLGPMPTDVFNLEKAIAAKTAGIVHSTVAYSRELALANPYLDGEPARLGVDDFCLFMTLAVSGVKFDYIPTDISAYRIHENAITVQRDPVEVEKFKAAFLDGLKVSA